MNQAQGVIEVVNSRQWKNLTFYSLKLQGDDKWYGCGTDQPPAGKGTSVSFTWAPDKKGYPAIAKGSIQAGGATGGNAAPAATTSAPTSTTSGGNSRDTYWKDKENYDKEVTTPRISYTAARGHAVSLVSAALAADALSFGSAAKGKRLDLLLEYVDEVTNKFFMESMDAHEHYKQLKELAENIATCGGIEADEEPQF